MKRIASFLLLAAALPLHAAEKVPPRAAKPPVKAAAARRPKRLHWLRRMCGAETHFALWLSAVGTPAATSESGSRQTLQ